MSKDTNCHSVRWCLLATVVISLSAICDGQILAAERLAFQRVERQSWLKLEGTLVNATEDVGVITDVAGQLSSLLRQLKMSYFPTAVSSGVNVSQQCVDDSVFYIESLLLNRSNWALQSKRLHSIPLLVNKNRTL